MARIRGIATRLALLLNLRYQDDDDVIEGRDTIDTRGARCLDADDDDVLSNIHLSLSVGCDRRCRLWRHGGDLINTPRL